MPVAVGLALAIEVAFCVANAAKTGNGGCVPLLISAVLAAMPRPPAKEADG